LRILLVTTDYDLIDNAQRQTGHSIMSTTTFVGATDLLKQHDFDLVALGVPYCDLPDIEAAVKKRYKQVIRIRGKEFIIPGANAEKTAAAETPAAASRLPPAEPTKERPAPAPIQIQMQAQAPAQNRVQPQVTERQIKQPEIKQTGPSETDLQAQALPPKPEPQKQAEPVKTGPVREGGRPLSDLLQNCRQILLISQDRETIVAVREGPYGGKTTVAVSQASARQIMAGKQVDLVVFDLNETPTIDCSCPVYRLGTDITIRDLAELQKENPGGGLSAENPGLPAEPVSEKPSNTEQPEQIESKPNIAPEEKAKPEPEKPGKPATENPPDPAPETRNTVAAALADEGTPKPQRQPRGTEDDTLLDRDLFEYAIGPAPLIVSDGENSEQEDETAGILGQLTQTASRVSSVLGKAVKNVKVSGGKKQKIKKIYQHVIGITGTKGGLGRTTLALDLAREISRDASVLIIDLNFQAGGSDLSYLAGLPQVPNFLTFRNEKRLQDAVQWCGDITILQPPPCDVIQAKIEPSDIESAVREGAKEYDIIVLDLPAGDDMVSETARSLITTTVVLTAGSSTEINRLLKKVESWPRPVVVVHGKNEAKTEKHVGSVPCWLLPKRNSPDYKPVVMALGESIVSGR